MNLLLMSFGKSHSFIRIGLNGSTTDFKKSHYYEENEENVENEENEENEAENHENQEIQENAENEENENDIYENMKEEIGIEDDETSDNKIKLFDLNKEEKKNDNIEELSGLINDHSHNGNENTKNEIIQRRSLFMEALERRLSSRPEEGNLNFD